MKFNLQIPIDWCKIMRVTLSQIVIVLIFTGISFAEKSKAQAILTRQVNLTLHNSSLNTALKKLEKGANVKFVYSKDVIGTDLEVSINAREEQLGSLLQKLLTPNHINYEVINDRIVLSKDKSIVASPVAEQSFTQTETVIQFSVSGKVTDTKGVSLPGVSILLKGTQVGVSTDANGQYSLNLPDGSGTLVFTYIGFKEQEIAINGRNTLNVQLEEESNTLSEVVVTGYGTQKRETLTGAIATVTSKDLDRVHGGGTVSSGLAGKIPGVTFRMPDGRPGASANIQIRNLGNPLYVIDGIQSEMGQFNNISPNDIESITVLKDASAAIYGVRAANGVVVVTTKRGKLNSAPTVNLDAYAGFQNWTNFPDELTSSYDYMYYKAEAEVNSFGKTNITPAELEKYKQGTEYGYQSFDWKDYIIQGNAPQNNVNVNITGGSDKVNYYVSGSHLDQTSVLGREFKFGRSNIQSNISAQVSKRLKVGLQINGRQETKENPGVPGGDDYWLARFAILRNTPLERPYANDNPEYINTISQGDANWAFINYKNAGKFHYDRRAVQANANAEYEIPGVKGLVAKALFSYNLQDFLYNNQEFTYKTYTYRPATQVYEQTGGSINPWREREQYKQLDYTSQLQLNYNNTFGKHTVGGILVAERIKKQRIRNWIHSVPTANSLPLIYFSTADTYEDYDNTETRIGYIGRVNYNYASRYYLELSVRRDASYLFAPDKRVGYFPGVSAGWRVTEATFMKNLLGDQNILNDFKIRGSYGVLGDDRNPYSQSNEQDVLRDVPLIAPYAYLPGYNYNMNGVAILDGNAVIGSRDKGIPYSNISWLRSKLIDIGADFSLLGNKLSVTYDYFYRKRTGLLGERYDILPPMEIGYALPQENVGSDAQYGQEISLNYNNKFGKWDYSVGGNISYSRNKNLSSYKPIFFNSWDQYRNSSEDRFSNTNWGYHVIGQFQSQDEINNYPVNIDNKGNSTLLPGDLIYEDINGDGRIDDYDARPIGYGVGRQPNINFGFNFALTYNNFDFHADFSGGAGYTWYQNYETKWAFQNGGNLNSIFLDRWHRADMNDLNSEWIPGKYPANRYNDGGHSNYTNSNDFFAHNVFAIRARTLELGYSLPKSLLEKIKIKRARIYANAYNLFTISNLSKYGVDPEVTDENGLQFPQNKVMNFGINLSL